MLTLDEKLREAALLVIDTGRLVDPAKWSVADAIAQLTQEAGELSEAAQHKMGKIDKGLPEGSDIEEAGDTIMCVIDTLSQANLDIPPEELLHKLCDAIVSKVPKWRGKIYAKGYNRQ